MPQLREESTTRQVAPAEQGIAGPDAAKTSWSVWSVPGAACRSIYGFTKDNLMLICKSAGGGYVLACLMKDKEQVFSALKGGFYALKGGFYALKGAFASPKLVWEYLGGDETSTLTAALNSGKYIVVAGAGIVAYKLIHGKLCDSGHGHPEIEKAYLLGFNNAMCRGALNVKGAVDGLIQEVKQLKSAISAIGSSIDCKGCDKHDPATDNTYANSGGITGDGPELKQEEGGFSSVDEAV